MPIPVPEGAPEVYFSANRALHGFVEAIPQMGGLFEKYLPLEPGGFINNADITSLYHHLFINDRVDPSSLARINAGLSSPLTPERLAAFKAEINALPAIAQIRADYFPFAVVEKVARPQYDAWRMAEDAAKRLPPVPELHLPAEPAPAALVEGVGDALPQRRWSLWEIITGKAYKGLGEPPAPELDLPVPAKLGEEVNAARPKGERSVLKRVKAILGKGRGGREGRADVAEPAPAPLSAEALAELGYGGDPLAELPHPEPYPEPPHAGLYPEPHAELKGLGEPIPELHGPERHPPAPEGGSGIHVNGTDRLLPEAAEDAAPARKGLLERLKAGADRIVDAIADTAASDLEHGAKSRPAPVRAGARYTPSTTVSEVKNFSRTKAAVGMAALAAAGWGLYEYNRRQEQPSQDMPLPPR